MARSAAQSLVEVTVGVAIFVPVLLVLLDLSIITFAAQQNDAVCRNAVQAAASGDPADALKRARLTVEQRNRSSISMIPAFRLVEPVEIQVTASPQPVRDLISEELYNPGGPVTGTATVTTEVDVRPFLVHLMYGGKSPLTFKASERFPIKYVVPQGRKAKAE